MKTALDILNEFVNFSVDFNGSGDMRISVTQEDALNAMKIYAEQAIEECTTVTEKESWLYDVGSTIPPGHALSNLVEKIVNLKDELK